ncbi:RNase adapter RapZ, partial [Streptomyces sp. MBT56]|nr:RNase adapter RapZ [Streptomyces sp. MBT56]
LGIDDIAVCGLAKRLEEVWLPDDDDPVVLPRSSEGLYLLQRIRDEAHRFAITYQRAKRAKRIRTSPLDDVSGLGETRKQALIKHFGSVKKLRQATIDEICEVPGIGRRTADLGWFVVDNLPPALIPTMVELGARSQGNVARIAVVVDVRGRRFFDNLRESLADLEAKHVTRRIVFLESSDDALVRRFESVRRPHPLQGDGRIVDGIAAERDLLRELRGDADLVIDTSSLNVHELRAKMDAQFAGESEPELRATVMSFGYKYGLPVDADLVVDCRFLPNPHWVPELRPFTGVNEEVSDYVFDQPGAKEFLNQYTELLQLIAAGYRREGKRYVTIAVGCTGGKHRSVAMSEKLSARLAAEGIETVLVHRDMGRE